MKKEYQKDGKKFLEYPFHDTKGDVAGIVGFLLVIFVPFMLTAIYWLGEQIFYALKRREEHVA